MNAVAASCCCSSCGDTLCGCYRKPAVLWALGSRQETVPREEYRNIWTTQEVTAA